MWFSDVQRYDDVQLVLMSTLTMWVAYWLLVPVCSSKLHGDGYVDASRWIAIVHDVAAAVWATVLWATWPASADELHGPARPLLAFSLGYFVWDLLLCALYPRKMGLDMLFHALVCAVGYTLALEPFMMYEATALLLFEWSTPCLHVFKLAQSHKWGLRWQLYSFLAFVALFFVFRVVWGSYFVFVHVLPEVHRAYFTQARIGAPWAAVSFGVPLGSVALNLLWFRQIVRKVTQKKQ